MHNTASQAWPWAPFDEMGEFKLPEPEPEPDDGPKPPWHPYSPPFKAKPPADADMIGQIQFKQAQKSACLRHGMVRLCQFFPSICQFFPSFSLRRPCASIRCTVGSLIR